MVLCQKELISWIPFRWASFARRGLLFQIENEGDYTAAVFLVILFGMFTTFVVHTCKHLEAKALKDGSLGWTVIGTFSTATRLAVHYLAMLVAMTYNVGLFIAICVGGGLGFVLVRAFHEKLFGNNFLDADKADEVTKNGNGHKPSPEDCC
mmetsp:Transcript_48798/g.110747  ORF Transcript_48798/g.110747 Transcript_48798/m.110747 type:complete len:151 (-) Transcript_48798:319-771(-)